ncbi:MAG: cupin [Lautropia sp.]|nr:cupin [Lautropia sp.]
MDDGWSTPFGYPDGIQEKILSGSLSEDRKAGCRTRLLRFSPGVYTKSPFVHTYWEEVYLISGDLIVGVNELGEGGSTFFSNTYACRPPGVFHGPFKSVGGCLLLEIHYYSSGEAVSLIDA